MDGNIIELVDLTKSYGSQTVVDKLSLSVKKGEVFGLLGPNGAGKSTTILMIMGLTEPDSGSVRVCNIDSIRNPIGVKKRVGYLPEDVGFYDEYSGLENLIFTARLNGISVNEAREKADNLLKRVGLAGEENKKSGKYSHGMRQRLGLADVLIKDPEVIILDEPTIGIDPTGVKELLELIAKLSKEEGITVLLSSHQLQQVQKVCDRVGLFVSGRLLAQGNIQTLSQQLFSNSAYTIEARISGSENIKPDGHAKHQAADPVYSVLRKIDGVIAVRKKDNVYRIECSSDLTPEISRAVVSSGANLNYLNKKEYGLDEIYYRYFEGGTDDE